MAVGKTLFDKIWDAHQVTTKADGTSLIYIDLHLTHEVTSPQAFEGLRMSNRRVRRLDKTLAVVDHNVPTTSDRLERIEDPDGKLQIETFEQNTKDFGLEYFGMADIRQGIVHVVGPEQGMTQPGMTIVCGDSHTATHGAFGALAFGIGTSEVEHVMATQTLVQRKARNMRIDIICHAQGSDPGHYRAYRHSRWHRLCDRIYGRGDPHFVDGRPHDGLQYVD